MAINKAIRFSNMSTKEDDMETTFIEWLLTPSIGTVIISFILLIALSFVPFMPMALIYGALAFAYPYWLALLINVSGTMLGAIIIFVICKHGLKGYYERKLKISGKKSKFYQLMQTNSFLAVLIARCIPILPTVFVNIVSAMYQMPLRTYVWATFIGKLPSVLIFTLVGNQLHDQNMWVVLLLIFYIVIITVATKRIKASWQV